MTRSKKKTGVRPRFLRPATVLLVAASLLGLYLLRAPLLTGVARIVEVEDALEPSDAILLLNGDGFGMARAERAAELFHQGIAPRILIVQAEASPAARAGLVPADTELNVRILRRAGVPASAIEVLEAAGGPAASTADEARALATYVRRQPARRVVVVTSAYHTGRTRWLIRREAGDVLDVRMAGAQDPRFEATDWWRSEAGMLSYFEEYVKFAHNFLFR